MSSVHLQRTIEGLAERFASALLAAVRSASLDEILGESGAVRRDTKSSAPARTKGPAPAKTGGLSVQAIVAELRKHRSGLRAEHLRKALGASKNTFNYHATKAIAENAIRKTGEKRATTYFVR